MWLSGDDTMKEAFSVVELVLLLLFVSVLVVAPVVLFGGGVLGDGRVIVVADRLYGDDAM